MEALTKLIVEGKLKRILTKLYVASLTDDPKVNYRIIALLSREFKAEFGLDVSIHETDITSHTRGRGLGAREGKTVQRTGKEHVSKGRAGDSAKARKAGKGTKVADVKAAAPPPAKPADAGARGRRHPRKRVTTRAK